MQLPYMTRLWGSSIVFMQFCSVSERQLGSIHIHTQASKLLDLIFLLLQIGAF